MLSGREMYGYEIVKAMRLVTGEAIGFGEGVIYPVLHSLEETGALKARRKSVNGRERVYRVENNANSGAYGIHVRIKTEAGDGIFSHIYAHFEKTLVKEGDIVEAGQDIGLADNTGNSSGAHLHVTLKLDGEDARGASWMEKDDIIDPTPYFPDIFPGNNWHVDVGGNFRAEPKLNGALIRWIPAEVRYIGFFSNFLLMASFLGIGIGILLGRRRSLDTIALFPILLVAVVWMITTLELNVQVDSQDVTTRGLRNADG